MEKEIENFKKEILRVLELDTSVGEIIFNCHRVEIPWCIEILNWCKEKGFETEISTYHRENISRTYVCIIIRNVLFKNTSACLFSQDFGAKVEFYNYQINEHSKTLKLLKENKKSVINWITNAENELTELLKTNQVK